MSKITDIIIVHNDPNFSLEVINSPYPIFTQVYDVGTTSGKKKGWAVKNEWSAKKDPFIICYDKETPVKAFYSEADNNIYESLNSFLNESTSN